MHQSFNLISYSPLLPAPEQKTVQWILLDIDKFLLHKHVSSLASLDP